MGTSQETGDPAVRDAPSGHPRFLQICPLPALTPVFPPVLVLGAQSSPPAASKDLPSTKRCVSVNSDLPPLRARSIGCWGASSGAPPQAMEDSCGHCQGAFKASGGAAAGLPSQPPDSAPAPAGGGASSTCPETPTLVPAWPTPAAQTQKKALFPAAHLEVNECNSVF